MINVLLVDDHRLIRDGIRFYLESEEDIKIIGEASNGKEGLLFLENNYEKVDLVMTDISMPEMNGIDFSKAINEKYPDIKILALTMIKDSQYVKQMLQAGASGYLLKNAREKEVKEAVHKIMMGENYFTQEATQAIMEYFSSKKDTEGLVVISPREKEVLRLVIDEFDNQQIADELGVGVRVVEAHKSNLLEKTGSQNLTALVKYALNNFLFEDL